jgi:hypothetical protein
VKSLVKMPIEGKAQVFNEQRGKLCPPMILKESKEFF